MVAWSVVTLLSYKARNYNEMLVCRFFLGLVEAPVSISNMPVIDA